MLKDELRKLLETQEEENNDRGTERKTKEVRKTEAKAQRGSIRPRGKKINNMGTRHQKTDTIQRSEAKYLRGGKQNVANTSVDTARDNRGEYPSKSNGMEVKSPEGKVQSEVQPRKNVDKGVDNENKTSKTRHQETDTIPETNRLLMLC